MINERESSIELLRIIAGIGVIILHFNCVGIGNAMLFVNGNAINAEYLNILECISICAVNLFIVISSYFLSKTNKRKISKIIELLLQTSVINILFYLFSVFFLNEKINISNLVSSILPANYFVILYIVLYVVSPYLNTMFDSLNKEQFKTMIKIVFLIFSIWSFVIDIFNIYGFSQQLSPISSNGSMRGYSIVNFVLLYCMGSYIRKHNIEISNSKLLISNIVCILIVFAMSKTIFNSIAFNYNNPFSIIAAISIFVIFSRIKIKNKHINEIAKLTFVSFLFNIKFLSYMSKFTNKYVNENILYLIIYQIALILIIFIFSYFIYKLYNFIISKTIKKRLMKLDSIDIYGFSNTNK